jgi:hypothetical protein
MRKRIETAPSLSDVRNAVDTSGYVLELRLAPKLERAGFSAWSDRQFQDQDTGKSREIDLYGWKWDEIASKSVKHRKATYHMTDRLDTHLVIECKSLSTPLVFFSRQNQLPIYGRLLFDGMPKFVWHRDTQTDEVIGDLFDNVIEFGYYHSYWSPSHLATRFGRMVSKRSGSNAVEWELEHSGIYSAIEKLSKAAMYIHHKHVGEAQVLEPEHTDTFSLHMTYPVLVVSGPIYECRVTERGYSVKPARHVFLDWSLTSERVKGSLRISVVTEAAFGQFLKTIRADIDGATTRLRRNLKKLNRAVEFQKQDPELTRNLPEY